MTSKVPYIWYWTNRTVQKTLLVQQRIIVFYHVLESKKTLSNVILSLCLLHPWYLHRLSGDTFAALFCIVTALHLLQHCCAFSLFYYVMILTPFVILMGAKKSRKYQSFFFRWDGYDLVHFVNWIWGVYRQIFDSRNIAGFQKIIKHPTQIL